MDKQLIVIDREHSRGMDRGIEGEWESGKWLREGERDRGREGERESGKWLRGIEGEWEMRSLVDGDGKSIVSPLGPLGSLSELRSLHHQSAQGPPSSLAHFFRSLKPISTSALSSSVDHHHLVGAQVQWDDG